MANHNLPTVTSNYVDVLSELDGRLDDIAKGLDPANTTATNVPTNSIRWSSASNKWEKWNGSAWADLSSAYVFTSITATGLNNTGNTTLGDSSADSVTINGTIGAGIVISGATSTDAVRITQTGTGNALVVEDSSNPDSTPFVIDANGGVIVGNTAVTALNYTSASRFQIAGNSQATTALSSVYAGSSTNLSGSLLFGKATGSLSSLGAVISGDDLGRIQFEGHDGTAFIPATLIISEVDGTPGTNDMPGRLIFSTTADGAATPTERMRISSTGETKFSYNAVIETTDNTNAALRITQLGTGNALLVEDSTNPDSSPFVINNSGKVVIGYTEPLTSRIAATSITPASQIVAASFANASLGQFGFNATPYHVFSRSGTSTTPTNTIVTSGDVLGSIDFCGADGTNYVNSSRIRAEVDGTPGTDDMPGRLLFYTTADGSLTPTERTRIDSAGRLRHFGTTILSNVDMLNASYDSVSFSVAAEEINPASLFFSPDGLRMFVLGATGDDVNQYSLSTPWVVSSASYVTNFSVSAQDGTPNAMFFRADGLKMYMIGTVNDTVYQYTLTQPWTISTASYDSVSFSVATQDTTPSGIFFKPNGLTMYVIGSASDNINQYALSTAWNVSTATFTQSFSVAGQETSPADLSFTGDGTRMFVLGSSGDDVTVYNLTTPWDISTASTTGQFSISGQDLTPTGLYVKPDGTKFYMVGSTNDAVYQYTIPSIDIQLTGTTAINGGATVAQDLTVDGNFSALNVYSGTYTPTLTNTTNVAASVANVCQYMRVGNVVTVSGSLDIDPTAANTDTLLGMSIPIASNFGGTTQAGGTFVEQSSQIDVYGCIYADSTNDRLTFRCYPSDASNRTYHFTVTYRII